MQQQGSGPDTRDARQEGLEWAIVRTLANREHEMLTGSPRLLRDTEQIDKEIFDLLALNLGAAAVHKENENKQDDSRPVELAATRRADCAQVLVKDDVVVVFCAVNNDLTLAVRSALAADARFPALLKGAAQDARDALLVRLGPPSRWMNHAPWIRAVVDPLVFDVFVPFFHPLALRAPLTNRIFSILSRVYADVVFDAPSFVDLEHADARTDIEEAMDLVDQHVEAHNDTFDEADLCLGVGSLVLANGALVHSSLCAADVHDVYRTLTIEGDLFHRSCPTRRVINLYAAVDRDTGARIPTFAAQRPGSDCVLEPRVLAVVAFEGMILARVLVSLQPSVLAPSGHLDPYGLCAMENALSEMLHAEVLQPFAERADAAIASLLGVLQRDPAGAMATMITDTSKKFPTTARAGENSEDGTQQPASLTRRGRAHSFDGAATAVWTRLTSSFRGRKRARASSMAATPVAAEAADEAFNMDVAESDSSAVRQEVLDVEAADLHTASNVDALRDLLRSPLARRFVQSQLGALVLEDVAASRCSDSESLGVGPPAREVLLRPPPPRALAYNPHCMETYLEEVTERSFDDIAMQYGLSPLPQSRQCT
ncbi:Hypothetical Protein FCC1311_079132 [Hondaea fermentalgiana]|uniref:Uncharacterized protein n=1 Tax=Hondaea fermentalgiana TaxID=2315210 RepID=A0A2R5GPH8_9STRA|nr:Hypothetical Protein FCC1311_079132 [Hondaea fermentalgiana]|eukprot:GBG31688.1 Hypothetical Protein FCC1311_079132 [Hondaea fermentalgiana]